MANIDFGGGGPTFLSLNIFNVVWVLVSERIILFDSCYVCTITISLS